MIVVFAAFTLGDFMMIKVLGFALAVAVLLDATVVRMAIGPALLKLAGRWNWWPGAGPKPIVEPERHVSCYPSGRIPDLTRPSHDSSHSSVAGVR